MSPTVVSDFTTLREGSLHAALKARDAATVIGARVEAAVDGFVVDVAGVDELVEIQTGSFSSARSKLERLVATYRVVLVYPIPIEKWLIRVDAGGGTAGSSRIGARRSGDSFQARPFVAHARDVNRNGGSGKS